MSVFGVISEFNPFHNGHRYLFEAARARGADTVVCVMSGNAVQRGEIAIAEKHVRAKMALDSGADLVLELPFPWSASSAESFAACGVRIASQFADNLIFGSECGDISALERAADIVKDSDFISEYKERSRGNCGSAQSYFDLLSEKTGMTYSSNDILGIEYIKAAKVQGSSLGFETVKREGGAYNSTAIEDGSLQSASAIRTLIMQGDTHDLTSYMPKRCAEMLAEAKDIGELAFSHRIENAQKLYFRMISPDTLFDIADTQGGLANRICRAALECVEGSMLELLRTKRYTDARIRRAMLFCLTGVRREDINATPVYTNLLAANQKGRELLAAKRKSAGIAVLAKPADIPDTAEAKRQAELSFKLDSIFAMALEKQTDVASIVARSPIIV